MKGKEKSDKKRYLSPSFKKGVVKEKKEDEDEGDFKINLLKADDEEEDEKDSKSPSKNKKKSGKGKDDKEKKEHHRPSTQIVPEDMKVNALATGRVKNVASLSQAGKGEDGFTKVNQDSFLVLQNEYNLKDFNIFSVMDGHGVNGHLVSRFVTKYFTRTCVMVFQVGNRILCGNVGDSRAIMVKGDKAIPLSIDQKPDDPEESKRIKENGGEISQYEEDGEKSGPFRVWQKGEVYPGIAMSRSIGDFIASKLGVIPEPKFIDEKIDKDTKFIVVASDGIWEFLDNDTVKNMVMPFYEKNDPNGACKELVKKATEFWNQEDVVVDDITVVVVFF